MDAGPPYAASAIPELDYRVGRFTTGILGRRIPARRWQVGLALALGAAALLRYASGVGPAPIWAAPSIAVASKLLPLYLVVLLGILVGRTLELDRGTIGAVLVRAISPVVFFGAVAASPITARDVAFPALCLAVPALVCLAARRVLGLLLPDPEARLAAFLAGSANVGYFGVPAALAVLPAHALGIYMLCLLGFAAYENTVGYYILVRSRGSVRDGVRRVLHLPAVHAIALGLAANWAGLSGGPELHGMWDAFRGCYVVLGMLALGLGLARLLGVGATLRFVTVTTCARFTLWPLAAAGLVAADAAAHAPLGPEVRQVVLLLAALPCATSGAIFAAELGLAPDKAAASVFVTTLLALLTVPLAALLISAGP